MLGVLVALIVTLYVGGAIHARPGTAVALPDLEILRRWIAGGHPGDLSTWPQHLAKPGYLLFLWVMLPRGGTSYELRRLLVFNAATVSLGIVAVCLALWKSGRRGAAAVFAGLIVLTPALRDIADWIASDSLALAFVLFFAAGLFFRPRREDVVRVVLGAAAAIFASIRPNVSVVLLLVAALVHHVVPHFKRAVELLGGFALGLGILLIAGTATGVRLQPFAMSPSQTLLFATADYFWPPDILRWPTGASREETEQLLRKEATERWKSFLSSNPYDRNRSLLWRGAHVVFSAEQFPGRWDNPAYASFSRFFRRWWWALCLTLCCAAAARATGGAGPWRFVPAGLLLVSVGQGFVFGSEPRFTLPLLPLLFIGVALGARDRPRRTLEVVAASTTLVVLAVVILRVPDAVVSDYAVAHTTADVIRQTLPASSLPRGEAATVHTRILISPPEAKAGLEIVANGRRVLLREPGDPSHWPASFSFVLGAEELEAARRRGLELVVHPAVAEAAFVCFPVVPPPLGQAATVGGRELLDSAYGGNVRGGFPIWVHAGVDSARLSEGAR